MELRNYGLPNATVVGAPRFKRIVTDLPPCPNCGCTHMAEIEVDIELQSLTGGKGFGHYVGCPACPFASPMVCVAAGSATAAPNAGQD